MYWIIYFSGFLVTFLLVRWIARSAQGKDYSWRDFYAVVGFGVCSWAGLVLIGLIALHWYFSNLPKPPNWL